MTFDLHPLAKREIEDASFWYEEQRSQLGLEFIVAVESAIATVMSQPDRYPPVGNNLRLFRMKRFPYFLYFRLHSERAHVRFIALLHHKRRPGLWKNR